MSILITGGAGFIGSHLAEAVVSQGHEVLILDNFSTGSFQNIAHLDRNPLVRIVCGSVTENELVRECVRDVDRVYHLASAVGVRLIVEDPVNTIRTIVEGTSVVLEACSRYRKPILLTSTSEVYGKSPDVPYRESGDLLIGAPDCRRWCYAASKALDEFFVMGHWFHTRLPSVVVRLFNTVGPRQSGQYGMVLPRFVTQALRNEPITVYGDGTQTRCFCHVKDVVGALVRLLDLGEAYGQVINLGSDEEVSINELADRVKRLTGSSSPVVHVPFEEVYGANFEDMLRRRPDLQRITSLLGYRPKYSLDEIIADVAEHVKENTPLPAG